jgi:hypothetical protein
MNPIIQWELLLHSSGLVPQQWGTDVPVRHESGLTSWVPGFINLPGHMMAGKATKKP